MRASWADSSWACAEASVASAVVGSTLASTWPAVTFDPSATSISVIVPLAPKLTSSTVAGATLPVVDTEVWTVPLVTVTDRPVEADAEEWKIDVKPK